MWSSLLTLSLSETFVCHVMTIIVSVILQTSNAKHIFNNMLKGFSILWLTGCYQVDVRLTCCLHFSSFKLLPLLSFLSSWKLIVTFSLIQIFLLNVLLYFSSPFCFTSGSKINKDLKGHMPNLRLHNRSPQTSLHVERFYTQSSVLSFRSVHYCRQPCWAVLCVLFWFRGDPSCVSQWAAVTFCTSAVVVVVVLMRYFPSITLPPTGPFVYDRVCLSVSDTCGINMWCGPTDSQNMISSAP